MKISRKVRLILGVVVIVAALVSLYVIYSGQAAERNDLNTRLARAQAFLVGLTNQKNDLENNLSQSESLLEASKSQFPQSVASIEYGEDFFKIAYGENLYTMADGCGVELTSLTASRPTDRTVGAVTYSVSSFVVTVSGSIGNVLKFIDAIGTQIDYQLMWSFQLPWSVDVKSMNINVNGSATISLDVYAYKG